MGTLKELVVNGTLVNELYLPHYSVLNPLMIEKVRHIEMLHQKT